MTAQTVAVARRRGAARLAALALGLGIAALAGWLVWARLEPRAEPIELRPTAPIAEPTLAARRAAAADPARAFAPGRRRLVLTPEMAREILPLDAPDHEFDPQCFLRHRANMNDAVDWPEHPLGRWRMRTNSLGLREDREFAPRFDGLRVLCTGDSHTDGVCENSESWPHRLEAELGAAHPERPVEVINAGKGSYAFYHYRGVLERLAHLEPDLFVVGVYGGNDFMETTQPWYYFAGAQRPRFDRADWQRLAAARAIGGAALAQIWNSVFYFHRFPGEIEVALAAALSLSADLAGAAEARGMRVLFVYIPSRAELDPDAEYERSQAALEELGLTRADLDTAGRMADRYLRGLAALDLAAVDLRGRFRAQARPPYWERDLHIDLAGHAAIGAELVPWVEPLLVQAR